MRVVLAALALVTGLHAALWLWSRPVAEAPAAPHKFTSLSFSPYGKDEDGENADANPAQVRKDIAAVAPYTEAIRTYSATRGLDVVAPLAAEKGLKVTQGIWIDKDEDRNTREIESALAVADRNPNVKALVVGNEVVLRGEKTVDEMVALINKVKQRTSLPVTTGEIWNVWLEYPQLASAVDFIAVHILPYWESVPADKAVDLTLDVYERLRKAFPGKHIVIAEFGWPSAGFNRNNSTTGKLLQAELIREFTNRARARGIDYNIVEALDQPWKGVLEGSVGPYWGVLDADRQLKFPLSGEIEDKTFTQRMIVALLIGFLLSLPIFGTRQPTFAQSVLLASATNLVGAWAAILINHWLTHYFVFGAQIAMVIGSLLLVPLAVVILSRIEEISAIAFGRKSRRTLDGQDPAVAQTPKVSIHIPAYREQPDMLIKTLDSVAALEYPDFECVVVINNTPDPEFWQPIEEHCRLLGDRFKFVNAMKLEGFKAGALRLALEHTAPEATIIGIIDADYVVSPAWLKDLVPAFADPAVGIVQAPQDHRDGDRTVLARLMNTEYAGFFDIGMVERNEQNAIIVHGTMCLLRRAAMDDAGGWSSDTICEDSDLGLTILEKGWSAHYTRKRYGWGLLPDNFEAFRKQRHRWTFGGMQIAMKHLKLFGPGASRLSAEQRRTYLIGWLNWMGAEAIGVAIAIMNLIWVPVIAFGGVAIPEAVLTIPILFGFAIYLIHFFSLYQLRVRHPVLSTIGASIAAMALQFTVARGVAEWVVKQHMPFIVTAKGGKGAKARKFPAPWELGLGGALVLGAALVWGTNFVNVRETNIFALVLLVQSLPFLAAAGLAWVEGSKLNDPAFIAARTARLAGLGGFVRRRARDAAAPVVAEPAPALATSLDDVATV